MDKSEDAVTIAPEVHTVIFENDNIRVLEVKLARGQKAKMHWHPDSVSYVVNGEKMQVTKPDGSSVEVALTPGQVVNGKESSHAVENTGTKDIKTLQIEFKSPKK